MVKVSPPVKEMEGVKVVVDAVVGELEQAGSTKKDGHGNRA